MRGAWAALRASHPEPVAAVTALTGLLCLEAGRGTWTVVVVLAALCGQLAVGWDNDLHDAELDRAQGRRDKPLAAGEIEPARLRWLAVAAAIACVPLSLATGIGSGLAHLAGLIAAYGYNRRLKPTPLSPLPFAVAFGLLPAVITAGPPIAHVPAPWALAAAALAGAGAHFTQSLPDIDSDRAAGLRGLPQLLGVRASAAAAALLLGGAGLAVALGAPSPATAAALLVAALAGAGMVVTVARGRRRPAFRLSIAGALAVVAGLAASGGSF